MLGLQAGIGALNDVVDAPRDAGLKAGKPIPAGLVSREAALAVAAGSAVAGLALAVPSGPATVGVALAILGIGAWYDLRLKGTPWSWLGFAVGIPLLPVFAWLGSGRPLPGEFAVLVPAAGLAGAALAIGNALVDVERDRAAGVTSIAGHLGREGAWRVMTTLDVGLVLIAVSTAAGRGLPAGLAATAVPAALVLAGAGLGRSAEPGRREQGWKVQVVGVATLAAAWLATALAG